MRRTGRVFVIFMLLLCCMAGLWLFQSWRDGRQGRERVLYNVYITDVSGMAVTVVPGEHGGTAEGPGGETADGAGGGVTYECSSSVPGTELTGVADLHMKGGKIVKIVKKPEAVTGTIQKIDGETITLDEYGEVALEGNFALYHKNGGVSEGSLSELVVGQRGVQFISAGERICAAVVPRAEISQMRVLLHNSDFSCYDQDEVVLTANTDFVTRQNGKTAVHSKGDKLTFLPGEVDGGVTVDTGGKGKIRIESLKRQYGVPKYRGKLFISEQEGKLRIVNEVPLEEYLYSVVPSEMPAEYSEEALKAQAVCARTYAVSQIKQQADSADASNAKAKRMAELGAHVDDGVSFQVYNNQKEDARARQAVKATAGQVVAWNGKTASTYFYACSCGSSAGTKEVWLTEKDEEYLPSGNEGGKNLSDEKSFKKFICSKSESYDSESQWFRWSALLDAGQVEKSIQEKLGGRFEANRTQIQKKMEDGSFRSEPVDKIGKIEKIQAVERGNSGVLSCVEIQGSAATIRVYTEYNIRTLLGGTDVKYERGDGSEVSGLSLLPSGFFTVKKEDGGYLLQGGGYGHGVGMSQNGANAMAKEGKTYAEILTFYFPGTTIEDREVLG